MIILALEFLEVAFLPYSTTIHPDSAVSENTIAVKLFQPLLHIATPIKAYQVEDQASVSNRAI
jgi:hypothetical protein